MTRRESQNHTKRIVESLKALKNEDKMCDVTIMIGQEEMKAHRVVLMAASKYFEAMFLNETKEAKTGIVEFVETPPEIVKQCIEYIYTGQGEFSMENAKDFMNASEMMQLDDLVDLYAQFLSERVSAENCIELMTLAQTYEKEDLKKCIRDFLLENFDAFSKAENFLSLDQDQLKYCLALLETCGEELEILKWKGIISWVKNDVENRRNLFSDLFKLIDLSYLSKQFIRENIFGEPLIRETVECLCIVTGSAFRDHEVPKASLIPQRTMSHMLACSNVSRLMHQYDLNSKEWSQVTRLPECDTNCIDIITHRGAIYVGTGDRLYRYSTSWTTLYDDYYSYYNGTAESRYYHHNYTRKSRYNRCISSGNVVYMITAASSIMYTLSSGKINQNCAGCKLGNGFFVAHSEKMAYALGGSGTERSSIELAFGQPISSMNYSRINGIAFWFNKMLYAVGGGPQYVECYNPVTDQWQVISGITISCSGAKAYLGDELYIFGGSQSEDLLTVELDKLKIPEDKVIRTPDVNMHLCCAAYL